MRDDASVANGTRRESRAVRSLRYVLGNLALALICLAVAKVSNAAAIEHRVVSVLWPSAGIAVFALVRFGPWLWPGVAVSAFLLNAMNGVTPYAAVVIAAGDVLEAVVGAAFVTRALGRRRVLTRGRDVLAVTFLAGAVSTLIAATIGISALVFSGDLVSTHAVQRWLAWWTSDAVGVLVVTPFLLVWTGPGGADRVASRHWAEGVALFAGLALVTGFVFGADGMLAFAVLPLALLASWRLGSRGAVTVSLVVTLIVVWRTLSGSGPFIGQTPAANLFALQLFIALVVVSNLLVAAARAEARSGEARVLASEKRYRLLAQKLPDGCVALYDRNLRILLVEGPAVESAGFTKVGLVGKRLADIVPPEQAEALGARFLAAIDGADVELAFQYQDRSYLVRMVPLDDEVQGTTLGMALVLDMTDRGRGQRAVAESQAQLERLSRLLITAQEDERRRVAREVHDELGQALTAVKIGLATTTVRRKPGESSARLIKASGLLDQAIVSVQQIVLRLRPGVLDNLGPLAALEYEVQQFRERSGIAVTLSLPPEPLVIRDDQATALYRTVQEALTNILRHAQATHVSVTLLALDHDLVLQVADDGVGISMDQLVKPRSMGMLGMRERAAACDGRLAISSGGEFGTCLTLRLNRDRAPEPVT